MASDDILIAKKAILELLNSGAAVNITDAARQLNLPPSKAYTWRKTDEDFDNAVNDTQQVFADNIETKLMGYNNFIPLMFMLKKIRPEYRDTYRQTQLDPRFAVFMERLLAAQKSEPPVIMIEAPKEEAICPPVFIEKAKLKKLKVKDEPT